MVVMCLPPLTQPELLITIDYVLADSLRQLVSNTFLLECSMVLLAPEMYVNCIFELQNNYSMNVPEATFLCGYHTLTNKKLFYKIKFW